MDYSETSCQGSKTLSMIFRIQDLFLRHLDQVSICCLQLQKSPFIICSVKMKLGPFIFTCQLACCTDFSRKGFFLPDSSVHTGQASVAQAAASPKSGCQGSTALQCQLPSSIWFPGQHSSYVQGHSQRPVTEVREQMSIKKFLFRKFLTSTIQMMSQHIEYRGQLAALRLTVFLQNRADT